MNLRKKELKPSENLILSILLILILFYLIILPRKLFNNPVCTVIVDKENVLLGAHIAKDGQWRFPVDWEVPEKYEKALIAYEDNRFYYHGGFDPISFSRAIWKNIKAGKIVNGGSTLTMQVIRMSRKNPDRTVIEKIIEILLATRMEYSYTKKSILALYASNAPFGGNVVGLQAASWRYFGRNPKDLSWAESAMLAVLPNSPSLIHPGRNRNKLFKKRNDLLKKLYQNQTIDKETYELSIQEPIPEEPVPFPQKAPHLLFRIQKEIKHEAIIKTTIDSHIQELIGEVLNRHYKKLSGNSINNAAAMVVEVETGNVIAYHGNIINKNDSLNGVQVDIITAARSTGSILKPLLYSAMLTSGDVLPNALIPDIPTQIGSFIPQNYNLGFDGAVPAKKALARSLNIPAVKLLQKYGIERFHYLLKKIGMNSIKKSATHYGLALILGGCEGSLWELTGIYAAMARTLNTYNRSTKYNRDLYTSPNYIKKTIKQNHSDSYDKSSWFSASAIWLTFQALIEVERPDDENTWRDFSSSQTIAWKTGTSFGFRDAWAIGITPKYVVGVWVGNADGEGRPNLIGVKASAPIMFDIFNLLPASDKWFEQPVNDMVKILVCRKSGYLASEICTETDSVWIPVNGLRFQVCPFHKIIHLDKTEKYQVTSDCESVQQMIHKTWFVLPPAIELYFKIKNPGYKSLPAFRDDCVKKMKSYVNSMEIIYPRNLSKIYVPIEIDGKAGKTVFEVAHRKINTTIFWHIDDIFVGKTKNIHKLSLNPPVGKHILTLIDEYGEKATIDFEIIGK